MTHFLLIHGSWHGAWCWHKIVPRLQSQGHTICAPDLPGRIKNPARPQFVGLSQLVKFAAKFLCADTKTTIVVHSRYGILASQLTEAYPERIERVIYIASYMLPHGERAANYFKRDKDSYLTPYVSINKMGLYDELDPAIYREGLYHDCADDDNMLGRLLLVREPSRPALAKLSLTHARYGRVPKAYIRLTQDRAVSIMLQDKILNDMPVARVESLDTSHSAYFSSPDKLTETIIKLSKM